MTDLGYTAIRRAKHFMHLFHARRDAHMTKPESKQTVKGATSAVDADQGSGSWLLSTLGTLVILAAIGAYIATEQQVVQDAEFTPLYQFTLDQAYSRFKASEQRVALNAPTDPIEAIASPQAAAQQGRAAQQFQANRQQQAAQQRAAAASAMDDGGPHTKRGNDLMQAGKYDEAIAAFKLALAENPQRILTRHAMGDALRYSQRHDEAIAVYREVLQQNPNYHCCYTHIGDIEKARNNLDAAKAAYAMAERGYTQQLEQGGPTASAAKYHLAKLYADQDKNLAQALVFAQEVAEGQPDQIAYQQLVAQIYEKLGRSSDAIAIYERLSTVNPQYTGFFRQQVQRLQQAGGMSGPPAPRQQ